MVSKEQNYIHNTQHIKVHNMQKRTIFNAQRFTEFKFPSNSKINIYPHMPVQGLQNIKINRNAWLYYRYGDSEQLNEKWLSAYCVSYWQAHCFTWVSLPMDWARILLLLYNEDENAVTQANVLLTRYTSNDVINTMRAQWGMEEGCMLSREDLYILWTCCAYVLFVSHYKGR